MASLQIFKSTLSPSPVTSPSSNFAGKPSWVCSEFHSGNSVVKLCGGGCRRSGYFLRRSFRVVCKAQEADNKSNGEEPPESLFMKELRRRGMSPATSLLEEVERTDRRGNDEPRKDDGGFSIRSTVSIEVEKSLANQRERSMQLNSEGLEGLIPRGRLLLTLGGTFFLAFWPFIVISVALFSALYLYFGPTFIHDANNRLPISPPQYIDPYELLEDERISQIAPRVK